MASVFLFANFYNIFKIKRTLPNIHNSFNIVYNYLQSTGLKSFKVYLSIQQWQIADIANSCAGADRLQGIFVLQSA
jgi:hypothetical protein